MAISVVGASAEITAALDRLKEELSQASGSNLAGLILYGGLARGRYRPGRSDVNVVVLLRDTSAASLAAVAPAINKAWRAARVESLLLSPTEVAAAADVFSTKFLDIKEHHVVLAGEDPFATLHVPWDRAWLNVEQQLRNLLLRLRRRYIAANADRLMLAQVLGKFVRPLAIELAALLRLAGKPVPADDRSATVFQAGANAFGLNHEVLAALAALRNEVEPPEDAQTLFANVLDVVEQVVGLADRVKEPPP